jgi:hypothetical protein
LTVLRHLHPDNRKSVFMTRKFGNGILLISAIVAVYGALAFFLITSLPPNGEAYGRLPSLYILFGGISGMLVGIAFGGLRLRPARE